MPSSSLSIALSALHAHSIAIDTTAHNIANAGTPGFRRQRVELQAAFPRVTSLGHLGSGVDAAAVSRATDRLADERVRRSAAQSEMYGARLQLASLAEDAFGEPSAGISTALGAMFDAFSALSTAPTDAAARAQVISSMREVAARINDTRAGLEGIAADAVVRLDANVQEINALSARVAEINVFPRDVNGDLPPDVADELDRTLDMLAARAGAVSQRLADGQVRVSIEGRALVDGSRSTPLTVTTDPTGLGEILHPTGPLTVGGTAGGIQQGVVGDLKAIRDKLDAFVASFASAMNDAHTAGYTRAGAAGDPLFDDVDGRLQLLVDDPAALAASDSPAGPLSGANADVLAQLRTSLGASYRDVTTYLSNAVATLDRSASTAKQINESSVAMRDSVVGVNLDEELTNLLSQQRAYEAAAKVISISDELLQTLINM